MMQHGHEGNAEAGGPASRGAADPLAHPSVEALALLHEVDHRVKNNLQLIASLILLQSRRAEDPVAKQALKSVLERVNAVTTVHRRLFHGDVQRFEAAGFLRDLAGDLAASAGRGDIEIALSLEDVQIPSASAAPFALIVNELISNALRHAFPEGRGGRIVVQLTQQADVCVFTLIDDGVGVNDAPPRFGLSLVKLLCQQLHAELEQGDSGQGPGSRFTLRTPLSRTVA
jgi:two-component sensor histidine kinase